MPIKVQCPNAGCGKVLAVKDEFAGKRAKCPACGGIIQIPNSSATPTAAIAPANPAPARPPAAPPPMEVGIDEGGGDWAAPPVAKSGMITAVAICGFVFGGLMILCGILGFIGGAWLTGASEVGSQFERALQEEARKQGKTLPSNLTGQAKTAGIVLTLYSVLSLLWGAASIPCGIGLLKRQKWGRMMGLVLGGTAGLLVILGLVASFSIGFLFIINVLLYLTYAILAFLALLNAPAAGQFT